MKQKGQPKMNKQTPVDRLNYSGSLEPVVDRICKSYGIGRPTDFSVIEVGYEDCNVAIETLTDKYVAKIFSKSRSQEAIARFSTIIEKAIQAGVKHPPLMRTNAGDVLYVDGQANGISLVLMKFIEGKTFFEMKRAPNAEELRAVVEQAALVNRIDYHPPYVFDSWAIPNIKVMFDRIGGFIKPEDVPLVERAIAKYSKIPVNNLPNCFVHGDFTKANVLWGDNGIPYILDFSVSNWYPRIQELAVITANLLHDANNPMSLHDKCELVASEYSKYNPLSSAERRHLYAYALAGIAMEFMGSHQEKYINGNDTEETEYWLKLGREGLKKELE